MSDRKPRRSGSPTRSSITVNRLWNKSHMTGRLSFPLMLSAAITGRLTGPSFSNKTTLFRFLPRLKLRPELLPVFKIPSEENVPSVAPLLQIENRRLSNYGALSPRNVSLLRFKLCSERWQTNDHFNFCQEEKHMAGANEVSFLILPLTETIWTE